MLACAAVIPLLCARSRRGRLLALAVALLAGLVIGTLSEETAVVVLVVLFAALLTGRRVLPAHARTFGWAWCAAGIAGTGIGALVLLASPAPGPGASGTVRRTPLCSPRLAHRVAARVRTDHRHGGHHLAVRRSGRRGALAGPDRAPRRRAPARPPAHRPLLATTGTLALLVSGYLCTVITYPIFGVRVATANRLWNDYLLLYIALLVGAGLLIGQAVRLHGRRTGPVKALCAALCVMVCVGPAISLSRLGNAMEARAQRWDHQDRWLRKQEAAGAEVLPYKAVTVSGMLEPFGRQGRNPWPAGCVAEYYHLERVTYSTRLPEA
ncbi:hypothetical protein NKH18_09085 [Streptomyces sp. M10(2022)]